MATEMKKVLIFGGKTGWIGQMMGELVKKEGERDLSPFAGGMTLPLPFLLPPLSCLD